MKMLSRRVRSLNDGGHHSLLKRLRRRLPAVIQICLFLILLAALSVSCRRQPSVEKATDPPTKADVNKSAPQPVVIVGKPYPGTGVITIINLKEGWVEINHEAIEGLMPAMQTEWSVKDKSLLQNVRVGDKVHFVVVETGKGEIITELKRVESPG